MTIDGTAFDFARDLRKPEVRAELKRLGFNGDLGHVIVPWLPGKTALEAAATEVDGRRVLLVRPAATDPTGWLMSWAPCCDLHNQHCEPPSELCCHRCTEVEHPAHPRGVRCALEGTP